MKEELKSINKSTIAASYGISVPTLISWIDRNEDMLNDLFDIGYSRFQKTFTPAQLEIIYRDIGKPK